MICDYINFYFIYQAAVDVFFEDFEARYVDETYFSKPDCYFTDDKEMNLNLTILKRFSDNAQVNKII